MTEDSSAPGVDATWLAAQIDDRTATGIAAGVARLIRDGSIVNGRRLPTVRDLAPHLAVSPATVSTAWSLLRRRGAVRGTGRQGTWVVGPPATPKPARYENLTEYWGTTPIDLTLAAPDPELLPDVRPALAAAAETHALASYDRSLITDRLRHAVAQTWPWAPDEWMAVNGGYEGIQLSLQANTVRGDLIAVEEPSTPRTLDILDWLGRERVAVATDQFGPLPESLAAALERGPAAFVYEPRASSGTGAAVSPRRAQALADVLAGSSVLIIEDDGVGEVSSFDYAGVGALLPDQAVLVRSYSKSHGPDLRIGVMGGCGEAVQQAAIARTYGAGWTSRLLQDALAWLLRDADSRAKIANARDVYAYRRRDLVNRLHSAGLEIGNRDGFALWVPVVDETQALVVLASHGIAAIPGSRFRSRSAAPAIRVTIGQLGGNAEHVATALVRAARVGPD